MDFPGELCVVCEPWRLQPLAWIHRAEAYSIASELRGLGVRVSLRRFDDSLVARRPEAALLLRVSDAVMREAARVLTRASIAYFGPGAAALERCYDKREATRIAAAAGIESPRTQLASEVASIESPAVLKPRRGSDSIGIRVLRRGAVPRHARNADYLVQPLVRGIEITIALLGECIGEPLHVVLREGTPYSFARKYLVRPKRERLVDATVANRVMKEAKRLAEALGVDWAVRIDWIYETSSGRLVFLECDAAPLVGAQSAFAASLSAAGVPRSAQLRGLLEPTFRRSPEPALPPERASRFPLPS